MLINNCNSMPSFNLAILAREDTHNSSAKMFKNTMKKSQSSKQNYLYVYINN